METDNIDEKFRKQIEQEEGLTIEEGNTLDDIKSIEEELLLTDWLEEARQIPLDMVTPLEKHYLTKYLDTEVVLDDEEKEILTSILEKYRPALQKVQPGEVLENLEGNTRIVEDEKAFLEYCDEFEQVVNEYRALETRALRLFLELKPECQDAYRQIRAHV